MALTAVGKQTRQTMLAVAFAGPPYCGLVAFKPGSDRAAAFASGDGQDDLGTSHLKPGQGIAMGYAMQSSHIPASNGQLLRSAPTHEATLLCDQEATVSIADIENSVQVL